MQEILVQIKQVLRQSPILSARGLVDSEAEQIVLAAYQNTTGKKIRRIDLYLENPNADLLSQVYQKAYHFAQQRVSGYPLQYLFGSQVFLENEYYVGPGVLVPRPETEVLVNMAVSELKKKAHLPSLLGLEIGLGSGIISIELLCQYSQLKIIATEWSPQAREYAEKNATSLLSQCGRSLRQLEVLRPENTMEVVEPFLRSSSSFGIEPGSADFLVSNPPYLGSKEEIEDDVLEHEPSEALFPMGSDPDYFYRKIAMDSKNLLKEDGFVCVEIPHQRAHQIVEYFKENGWRVSIFLDLSQRERVLLAKK